MSDNTPVQPPLPENEADKATLEELATGFRMLGDDSPLKRFAVKLAKKGDMMPTPYDMAVAITTFADKKLKDLTLPEKPGDIRAQTLEAFTERLSDTEVKALQYAAGREDTITRRSILGGFGLAFGAAMAASGTTVLAYQDRKSGNQSAAQPQPADAGRPQSHPVPEPATLLAIGGALLTVASLMQNLRRRKENTTAFEAERHIPQTAAQILIETDKQLKQAIAAKTARGATGEKSR
ncbi:MAG: PEP-CTERM sorting domain-containing protein [Alphaproteobacteria bacterium]